MLASRQAEYTVLPDRQMLYTGSQSGPINSQLDTSPLRPWVNSSALQQKQDPSPVNRKDSGKSFTQAERMTPFQSNSLKSE